MSIHPGIVLASGGLALLLFGGLSAMADSTNLEVSADTFINARSPDNNAGGMDWFDAGRDGAGGVRRGLLRFDLSPLPPGSTVTSAVLRLTVTRVPVSGLGGVDSTFDLFRLTADWTEGTKTGSPSIGSGAVAAAGETTWNSRMSQVADWTMPGAAADVAASPSASTPVGSAANAAYAWTGSGVVADVQSWIDDPASNFGWLLRSDAEETARSVRGFASRESGSGFGTLQVEYVPSPVVVTNPIVITRIVSAGGTNVVLSWTGGNPPYAVEMKAALSDLTWSNAADAAGTQATVRVSGSVGFLRVSGSRP